MIKIMLPIMPPHFMNPSSRNGHLTKNKTTTTTAATITDSNDKDNFFKIENILNRTIDTQTQNKKYLNNGNNKNNNNKKQQQQLQNDKLNNNNNSNTINNGVYSIEKIPKDSITCSISSDELLKNCNNRKIKVKISNSDGYIRSISFKSDSSWIKCIQLAKDVHSNNVIIETTKLNNNQIRLRTIKDIDENEELIVWFSEEISIMMNIPFLTPINIRGNNCYTCHICKASFEYPNPLKIHLATSCTRESIDTLWKNLSYTIKKNCLVSLEHEDEQLIQTANIKSKQHQIPNRISSEELSSSVSPPPLSLSLPTSTSLATHLLFSTHHNNFLMKSQQSSLYNSQYDRQSAFKPVTTPPPPAPPTTSFSLKQPQKLPQQLPPVTMVNHIPSHSFNLHRQNSIPSHFEQQEQHHPILHKSSSMHYRPLFNSSLPSSSSVSTTLFPSSSLFYSSASSLTTNALLATSLSSSSTSSLSPSIFSLSPHHHQHHHHHQNHHQQITQQPITLSQTVSASQAAAAAAAALNAAAQIETIVSNMGASKQGHLCIYCGKLYSRKYGLKIHIRTHTGFKPLKCKYCFRPFGDPSNLNKHVRLHMQSGNLSFRCHLCNKTLARRRDLQRHIETKHCTGNMDNMDMDVVVVDDDNNTSSPTSPFTIT